MNAVKMWMPEKEQQDILYAMAEYLNEKVEDRESALGRRLEEDETADLLSRRVLFFFNDTSTTEIYTLSLHDALPISDAEPALRAPGSRSGLRKDLEDLGEELRRNPDARVADRHLDLVAPLLGDEPDASAIDRKSTRLNSSHSQISYAVFCLKKKINTE